MKLCHLPVSSSCFEVVVFQQLSKDILYIDVQSKCGYSVNTPRDYRCCMLSEAVFKDFGAELEMKLSGDE